MIEALVENSILFIEHVFAVPRYILSSQYRQRTSTRWEMWLGERWGRLFQVCDILFHLLVFLGGCAILFAIVVYLIR